MITVKKTNEKELGPKAPAQTTVEETVPPAQTRRPQEILRITAKAL